MIVKVCGIRDVDNLKQLIKLPINWVGFIFYKDSSRFVELHEVNMEALSLMNISDFGLKKVGVFVDHSLDLITEKVKQYQLDHIQLHGEESYLLCKALQEKGHSVIKAFSIDESFDFSMLNQYAAHCDYFLFDTKGELKGGNGVRFNWEILKEYTLDVPFLLSGGIGPEALIALSEFSHPQLAGIDLNSKFELRPGFKDEKLLDTFVKSYRKTQVAS